MSKKMVKLVVNCTNDREVPCFHESKGLKYVRIAVNDNESADLLPYLDGASDAIAEVLRRGENVLVHCHQGVSRSATVVAAFLLKLGAASPRSPREVVAWLKTQRAQVEPNLGFRAQLEIYADQLRAKARPSTSSEGTPPCVGEEWCRRSLALYAVGGAKAFEGCRECREANEMIRWGLDFVLGRGLNASDVRWLGALLESLKLSKPLELLREELASQWFHECWGPDVSRAALEEMRTSLQQQVGV